MTNIMTDFEQLDRDLADFRNAVAVASTIKSKAVARYIAMMELLDSAFLLFWEDMPEDDRARMKQAFDRLADTVRCSVTDTPDNVRPIKK